MRRALIYLFLLLGWGLAGWLGYQAWWDEAERPSKEELLASWDERSPAERALDSLQAAWQNHPGAQGAILSFVASRGKDEPVLLGWRTQDALAPASTLKVLTAAVALDVLTPKFVFTTQVLGEGLQQDQRWVGNLNLIGSGDPFLDQQGLQVLATALAQLGVRVVEGDLIIEHQWLADTAPVSDHWNWGDVGNGYGAGVWSLNLFRNRYVATFQAGSEVGAPAEILQIWPTPPEVLIQNEVLTGPVGSGDGVMIYGGPKVREIVLRGTVPLSDNRPFHVTGALPDPPLTAGHMFRDLLLESGVTITGNLRVGQDLSGTPLAQYDSEPLPGLLQQMQATSDNVAAQALFLRLGGEKALRQWCLEKGIMLGGARIEDGSGLARANRLSAADLAAILRAAIQSQHGAHFLESLPRGREGTLRYKVGFMSGVRSLAGLLEKANGEEVIFAINTMGLSQDFPFQNFVDSLLNWMEDW